jgi:peptide-methionine (S)-S-oxide reductase
MKSFVLGGGCFWCLDSALIQLRGVQDIEVGYMGGDLPEPTYEQVCSGQTGHAEVARVHFDDAVLPADVLLDAFFTLHDPTQLNRQGHDVGTQYRSCMFYADDSQRVLFENAKARAQQIWPGTVVTEISPAEHFWIGEEYHQDFFAKNPNQGYCNFVVKPKMQKTAKEFASYLK